MEGRREILTRPPAQPCSREIPPETEPRGQRRRQSENDETEEPTATDLLHNPPTHRHGATPKAKAQSPHLDSQNESQSREESLIGVEEESGRGSPVQPRRRARPAKEEGAPTPGDFPSRVETHKRPPEEQEGINPTGLTSHYFRHDDRMVPSSVRLTDAAL